MIRIITSVDLLFCFSYVRGSYIQYAVQSNRPADGFIRSLFWTADNASCSYVPVAWEADGIYFLKLQQKCNTDNIPSLQFMRTYTGLIVSIYTMFTTLGLQDPTLLLVKTLECSVLTLLTFDHWVIQSSLFMPKQAICYWTLSSVV